MATTTVVHVIFHPKWGPDFSVRWHMSGVILDPNDTNVQLILTAINAVTRAVAIEIALSTIVENNGSVTTGVPYVNEDKAQFVIEDEDGNAHNFKIPGLLSSLLETGKEEIDFTIGDPATWVAAMVADANGAGGQALTVCVNAYRTENRKRLKSGVFTGN